jgi:hypothetical protein
MSARQTSLRVVQGLSVAALVAIATPALADDPPPPLGWYYTGGLSYVLSAGNSGASTLGAKVEVKRLWSKSTFTIGGSAIRSDANDPGRIAIGTPDDFEVENGPSVEKTAKYNARTAFDRRVSDRFGWQAGAEFDRDIFAGLEARNLAYAGASYLAAKGPAFTLKTGFGLTLTHQSDVVDDPATANTFAGLRLAADAEQKFGTSNSYIGGVAIDENLTDTEDLRVRFTNTLALTLSKRLALQVGLLLLYDNQPSLVDDLPLFDFDGAEIATVVAPAAKLDTTFTVSLVVNFAPKAPTP